MNVQTSKSNARQTNNPFVEIAKEAVKIIGNIEREYGESGGGYWQPYAGRVDIDCFRITIQGSEQCQFGSNDFGTLTVQLLDIKQTGKTRTETTEEVLKFEYEMSNGCQHLVLDPKPMALVPKLNDRREIRGKFSPGTWQDKFLKIMATSLVSGLL